MRIFEIIGSSIGRRRSPQLAEERKYIPVNNREKIGIDGPHLVGQQVHGHLENGRAVNKDGSISHGGPPFHLTRAQAAALRSVNFDIPKSRLIESEGDPISVPLDVEIINLLIQLRDSLDPR